VSPRAARRSGSGRAGAGDQHRRDLAQTEAVRALGVVDVFTKPVAAGELVAAVRRALAER
jgi:CheY-like chemotaxis protein